MVNKSIKRLDILSESLGKLTYSGTKLVGQDGKVRVAELNVNGTLELRHIKPQAGFNFEQPMMTPLKLVDAQVVAGGARTNTSRGAKIATIEGTLLPLADSRQDRYKKEEFDSTYVSGKDRKPVAQVRTASAFDKNSLLLVNIEPRLEFNDRNEPVKNEETGEPTVGSYALNLIPESKRSTGATEDDWLRIIVEPAIYDRNVESLKLMSKVVPSGIQFAFSGSEATDWTIYASDIEVINQAQKPMPAEPVKPQEHKKEEKN